MRMREEIVVGVLEVGGCVSKGWEIFQAGFAWFGLERDESALESEDGRQVQGQNQCGTLPFHISLQYWKQPT